MIVIYSDVNVFILIFRHSFPVDMIRMPFHYNILDRDERCELVRLLLKDLSLIHISGRSGNLRSSLKPKADAFTR